jgi:hypothetical protein
VVGPEGPIRAMLRVPGQGSGSVPANQPLMSGQISLLVRVMTTVVAVLAVALVVLAALLALWPRSTWVWSWERPTQAGLAAATGVLAATGAVLVAARIWHRSVRHPVRFLGAGYLLLSVTTFSTLVLLRSGTLLSDVRVHMVGL